MENLLAKNGTNKSNNKAWEGWNTVKGYGFGSVLKSIRVHLLSRLNRIKTPKLVTHGL